MPRVKICTGPRFDHILMRITFLKITKITMKCMISTEFHDEFESYKKVLAKWPNCKKNKSFWPKYTPLAKAWLQTIPKCPLAKFWPLIIVRNSQKIQKQLKKYAHLALNRKRGKGIEYSIGQRPKPPLKHRLWPKTCLARGAKPCQVSKWALG